METFYKKMYNSYILRDSYLKSRCDKFNKKEAIAGNLFLFSTLFSQKLVIEKKGKYHQVPIQIMKQLNKYNDQDLREINNKIKQFNEDSLQYLSLLSVDNKNIFEYLLNQSEENKEISFQIILSLVTCKRAIVYFTRTFPQDFDKLITYASIKFNWQYNFEKFESQNAPRFATIFQDKSKLPDPEKQFALAALSAQILEKLSFNCQLAREILYKRVDQLFLVLENVKTIEAFSPIRINGIVKIIMYLITRQNYVLCCNNYYQIINDFSTRVAFFNNQHTLDDLQQEVIKKEPTEYECLIINKSGEIIQQGKDLFSFKLDTIFLGMLLQKQLFDSQIKVMQQQQKGKGQQPTVESYESPDLQKTQNYYPNQEEIDKFNQNTIRQTCDPHSLEPHHLQFDTKQDLTFHYEQLQTYLSSYQYQSLISYINSRCHLSEQRDKEEQKIYQRNIQEQKILIENLGNFHQDSFLIIQQLALQNDQDLVYINNKLKLFCVKANEYLSLLSVDKKSIFEYLLNNSEENKQISFQIILVLLTHNLAANFFMCKFSEYVDKLITYSVVKLHWSCNFEIFNAPPSSQFATIIQDKYELSNPEKQFSLAALSAQILERLAYDCVQARCIIKKRIYELFQVLQDAQTAETFFLNRLKSIVKIIQHLIVRSNFHIGSAKYCSIINYFSAMVAFFNNQHTLDDLQQEVIKKEPTEYECLIINKSGEIIQQGKDLFSFKLDTIFLGMLLQKQLFDIVIREGQKQQKRKGQQPTVESYDFPEDLQLSEKYDPVRDEIDRFKKTTLEQLLKNDLFYIDLIISSIIKYKKLDDTNYYKNDPNFDEFYQDNFNQIVEWLYKLSYIGLQYLSAISYGKKYIFDYLFNKSDQQVATIQVVFGLIQYKYTTEYFVSSCSEHLDMIITNSITKRTWNCEFDTFHAKFRSKFSTIIPNNYKLPDMTDLDVAIQSAQVLSFIVSNQVASIFISKRITEIFQVLQDFETVELFNPRRISNIFGVIFILVNNFQFDLSNINSDPILTVHAFLDKVFFNNSYINYSDLYQSKLNNEANVEECAIRDINGQILFESEYLKIIKNQGISLAYILLTQSELKAKESKNNNSQEHYKMPTEPKYSLKLKSIKNTTQLLVSHNSNLLLSITLKNTPLLYILANPDDHSSQIKLFLAYQNGAIVLRHLFSFQLLDEIIIQCSKISQLAAMNEYMQKSYLTKQFQSDFI